MRTLPVLLAALAIAAMPAADEDHRPFARELLDTAAAIPGALLRGPVETRWITPSWSVRAGAPTVVEVGLSAIVGPVLTYHSEKTGHFTTAHGLIVGVRPGLGGIRCDLGYANVLVYERRLGIAAAGWDVRAGFLRTWENAIAAEPNRSYLGASIGGAFFLAGEIGLYRTIDDGEEDTALCLQVGVGL